MWLEAGVELFRELHRIRRRQAFHPNIFHAEAYPPEHILRWIHIRGKNNVVHLVHVKVHPVVEVDICRGAADPQLPPLWHSRIAHIPKQILEVDVPTTILAFVSE